MSMFHDEFDQAPGLRYLNHAAIALLKSTCEGLSLVALAWRSARPAWRGPTWGTGMRFSPHFYTSEQLIDEAVQQVRRLAMH